MKRLLAAAACMAVAAAFSTTALADSTLTKGTLVSFSYNADTNVGKLVIKNKSGKSAYRVDRKTDCGVSYGNPPQSGDSIRCRTLGKDKYDGRPVRVTWHRGPSGNRVADVVAVALP